MDRYPYHWYTILLGAMRALAHIGVHFTHPVFGLSTTNPLPAHSTHAVPPPAGGIHFIDFDGTDDFMHMMSWDDHAPEPIMLVEDSEVDGFVSSTQLHAPFSLIPDVPPFQLSYSHD